MARIENIEQLCDAQADLSPDSDYWTALKLNIWDSFQWGPLPNNSANVPLELLDRTKPVDRCYAISKSTMKLKSMNCSCVLPVLTSYSGEVYLSYMIIFPSAASLRRCFFCTGINSVKNSYQLILISQKKP